MQKLINKLVSEINSKNWLKLKNKIRNFPNIECSTSNADCFFLALLVKKYKPINILEIGTFVGKSTYSLACAAKSNCKKFCIDTIDIQKKLIKKRFAKFKEVKFYNGHSSKLLPNFKKKYDFIFIDANLDNETVIALKKLIKKKTLIVLHDFCPPMDKGIYDLFYLSKFMSFVYYEPIIEIKKNSIKYINPLTTEVNFLNNIKIDKNKINLCCCLISFQPLNGSFTSPKLSNDIKGYNVMFLIFLIIIVFFDQLLQLKKRIYVFNFLNKQVLIDLHEKKLNYCIIKNGYIFLKKIYFINNFTLKLLTKFTNLLLKFKI